MPISLQCPSCGKKLKAPDQAAGKTLSCPNCQGKINIPMETIRLPATSARKGPPPLPPVLPSEIEYDGEITEAYEPEDQESGPKPIRRREKDCLSCGEAVAEKARVCKHCGADPDEEPMPKSGKNARQSGKGPSTFHSKIIRGALMCGFLFACLGFLLSQYYPVFGGILEKAVGEPWSPARKSLIPIHLFVFGLIGLLIGGADSFLRWKE
jgi:hypothetical protein